MHGLSDDPRDEIAAAVLAHADRGWDASSPPRSPQRHSSSSAKAEPALSVCWDVGLGPHAGQAHLPPAPAAPSSSSSGSGGRGPQRPKQYKTATPSRFCHVCGRKSANIRVAVCGRLARGLCRKVICELCFRRYGWDRADLLDRPPDPRWLCPHCRGICVPKAQCNTYKRTNMKRHLALRERRGRATSPHAPLPTHQHQHQHSSQHAPRAAQRHAAYHHPQRGAGGALEHR